MLQHHVPAARHRQPVHVVRSMRGGRACEQDASCTPLLVERAAIILRHAVADGGTVSVGADNTKTRDWWEEWGASCGLSERSCATGCSADAPAQGRVCERLNAREDDTLGQNGFCKIRATLQPELPHPPGPKSTHLTGSPNGSMYQLVSL